MIPNDPPSFNLTRAEAQARAMLWMPAALVVIWISLSAAALALVSPDWFQRCGAVGVAAALVGFAILRSARQVYYDAVFEALVYAVRKLISSIRHEQVIKANPAGQEAIPVVESMISGLDQTIDASIGQLTWWHGKDTKFLASEIIVTVLATVQWGFGDMIVKYFLVCGRVSCSS